MYKLCAEIVIESERKWTFDKITSCEITRDKETLTDVCVVTIPRKVKWDGEDILPIKRGDKITVRLGYDSNLQLAFKGYITTIGIHTPITITCEDEMFKLKSVDAKKLAYRSVTLEQLLSDQQLEGIKFKVFGEQNIGQYRITAKTITELFGHLKDNGGIRCFFRLNDGEPVLYCGVLFPHEKGHTQVFSAGAPNLPIGKQPAGINIVNDDELKVQDAKDIRLKIKAISMLPNNKRICLEVGDADGEKRTIHAYNKTEKELKAWAEQELERLKQDGLSGSFTTFGDKLVEKFENVAIKLEGERKGVYQVDKNIIKYGNAGFHQEITLGARVAE